MYVCIYINICMLVYIYTYTYIYIYIYISKFTKKSHNQTIPSLEQTQPGGSGNVLASSADK